MKPGYIYILTNESMPGMVKIGRTERQPETRSKELHTTGVPQPFKLEYFVFVEDCHTAEYQIHSLLEKKGLRNSKNREFFNMEVNEAIEIIEFVENTRNNSKPDFRCELDLQILASKISIPLGYEPIERDDAERLSERLAQIARRGYPDGMKRCAEIFEVNSPSALLFRNYWREFLELSRAKAIHYPLASGGKKLRYVVGQDAAEYIARLHSKGWLQEEDFSFISDFLISGDQFQYEGYIQQISRYNLPILIKKRAEEV